MVLLEGAGGLMVPITRRYLTIDYIADQKLPVILVTSGRLGSINHTLLSIEALVNRNIPLYGIVYNTFPKTDERIDKDTEEYLKTYLNEHFPQAHFGHYPRLLYPDNRIVKTDEIYRVVKFDLSGLFNIFVATKIRSGSA